MQILHLPVDNVDSIIAAFGGAAVIRWESAPDGVSFNEVGTSALVAGTTYYEFADPDGTTTTYYRTRYSKASPGVLTDYTGYSESFLPGEVESYATVEELVARLTMPDRSRYGLLEDLLTASARYLDSRIGFDFLRHPRVSGTETRVFDVPRRTHRIPIVGGIVSATSVSVASITGETPSALGAEGTDWYLHPRQLEPEGTYTHLTLLRSGSSSIFTEGQGTVSITGAFGWATPPTVIKEATLAHAARSYHEWQTKQAGVVGNPDFGGTINLTPNLPDVVYRAIETYRRYWWRGV